MGKYCLITVIEQIKMIIYGDDSVKHDANNEKQVGARMSKITFNPLINIIG